ncbi:endonuclease/exonuclease/phosphatase family protein [Aliikangiella coralliicola]|uniref:Endonuclease/exonuclease/phosphatase family protein n=1 Tax=Aliikangiella coralliicola TaxID=2592383 RepID=A0A545UF50_9GAMM|nr:endonuclease/exonuclease/phosphatase family protein [Aliikangiella coralliicola]TQV88099.1 endonuclease/exonuclease/phosphatase family protein [Aliikangiella coralliicola]
MAKKISFASFNLYNLQEAGKKVRSKVVPNALYDKKIAWTRKMLIDLDADVIAFQELWSRKCLDKVFRVEALSGYQLVYITQSFTNPWYGIAVAVAVRTPWKVKYKKLYKKFPFKKIVKLDENDDEDDEFNLSIDQFSRTVINLTLENPTSNKIPDIDVFAAHLKSKLPASAKNVTSKHRNTIGSAISTIRRTAEAAALRWILTNRMKYTNKPTVLLGDLNDDPRSNTLALITEQPSLTPSSTGRDTALYSALKLQQLRSFRDVFYTHEFNRLKDTLDHILVSEEFFESSNKSVWRHLETRIWNDFLEDDSPHTSDHGIIKAIFQLS